jgi:hypothetical protein
VRDSNAHLRAPAQRPRNEALRSVNKLTEAAFVTASVSAAEHPPQAYDLSVEDQRVVGWRFEQFRQLGYSDEDAWMLVDSGADLQLTRSLIGAGCPLHLALRIVV